VIDNIYPDDRWRRLEERRSLDSYDVGVEWSKYMGVLCQALCDLRSNVCMGLPVYNRSCLFHSNEPIVELEPDMAMKE